MRTPTFDFVGRSRLWVIVSGSVVALSLASLLIGGLDLSIDFVGGQSYELVDVRDDLTSQELREAAEDEGAQDVIAQLSTDGEAAVGATVRMEALEPGSEQTVAIRDALLEVSEATEFQEAFVGPTWGERISRQALEALLVFLVVITIYISFRLEFKMAIAAVVALAHDLIITIGLYSLLGFNVSPATVIALLTILGYSLYDTVVVFDRVKENSISLGDPGRRTYAELVNSSMNEVVYRSINTSITSLLPVGALLFIGAQLLGATTLQDLALALFIGMAVGIYSSLFVAGPFFAFLKMREPREQRRAAKVAQADAAGGSEAGGGSHAAEVPEPEPVASPAPAPGSPEARAPITTDYVRGQGKGKKRRKR
jgi:preprotein translocase subunit SecF